MKRFLAIVLLSWMSLTSLAAADVILPGNPPRPWRPRYPTEAPAPTPSRPPVAVPTEEQEWHPNIEREPEPITPEDLGFMVAITSLCAASLFLTARSIRQTFLQGTPPQPPSRP